MAVYQVMLYVLVVLCNSNELTTSPPSQSTSQPTTGISLQLEGTLFCGDSITGSTTASQRIHYYRFTTPPYIVSALFDSCGSGYDTYLYFNEPNGTRIAECNDCGSCGNRAQLPVASVSSGDYVLGVGGYSSGEVAYSAYGVYSMSVTCNFPKTCCDCVTQWDNFCSDNYNYCCDSQAPDNFCIQDPACLAIICAKDSYCCDNFCVRYAWLVCEMQTVFDSTSRPAINTSLLDPIKGTLFCGDSVTGSTTPSQRTHYYRFTAPPYPVSVLFSYDWKTYGTSLVIKAMNGTWLMDCDGSPECVMSPVYSGDYLLAIRVSFDCGAYGAVSVNCSNITTSHGPRYPSGSIVHPSGSIVSSEISSTVLVISICGVSSIVVVVLLVVIQRLKRKVKHYKEISVGTGRMIATNEENEGTVPKKKEKN